jgi:tRNA (mo5U34)-methyltransferase
VPFWFHSIDLGHGVTTPGLKSPEQLRVELDRLHLPDLRGKTFLDVGAWDGYFSFAAERAGATRVVALDHYVWKGTPHGWEDRRHKLPPKQRGVELARRALRSEVEILVGDFTTMDLGELDTFDVVLFSGVLYHLQDPIGALQRVAQVTEQLAVIETASIEIPQLRDRALCEFYEKNELNDDSTNWWAPNAQALCGLCRAAGFVDVDIVWSGPPGGDEPLMRGRLVSHAHR